jgi:hypothetical protein
MEGFKTKKAKGVLCGKHSEGGRMTGDNDAGVDDDMRLEYGSGSKRWELPAGERLVFNGGLSL